MEARVGTLPVGTLFDTLLTGRRGVVRAQNPQPSEEVSGTAASTWVKFADRRDESNLHGDVRVRVVEVTH